MPALSPTMESGSISKWNVKEGDRFEPGTSLCDVETDKATVSFDATEEGYIAKILIASGDIKVGQPLLVTVDEAKDVSAFASFSVQATAAVAAPTPAPAAVSAPAVATATAAVAAAAATPAIPSSTAQSSGASSGRIFASPLAKKLVKEAGDDLQRIASIVAQGSGPNGRIVAGDVREALKQPRTNTHLSGAASSATSSAAATNAVSAAASKTAPVSSGPVNAAFEEFTVSDSHREVAAAFAQSKQTVPHYYVSVELNLTGLLSLRDTLNQNKNAGKKEKSGDDDVAVLDLLVKAAGHAMRSVPDVNAAWMDTFVRQYHQVDINVVMGEATMPVLRDVGGMGIGRIAETLQSYEQRLSSTHTNNNNFSAEETGLGTFTIHNLGMYGVRSAVPILRAPQAAALALGSIVDTVVPNTNSSNSNSNSDNNSNNNSSNSQWTVAPMMVATIVCDHRVVDGAVAAQWLAALKNVVENPVNLLM